MNRISDFTAGDHGERKVFFVLGKKENELSADGLPAVTIDLLESPGPDLLKTTMGMGRSAHGTPGGVSNRKALAALCAPGVQYCPSSFRTHAKAKSVFALPLQIAGLEGSFQG